MILGGNWNGILVSSGENVQVMRFYLAAYLGKNPTTNSAYELRINLINVNTANGYGNSASRINLDVAQVIKDANTLTQAVADFLGTTRLSSGCNRTPSISCVCRKTCST